MMLKHFDNNVGFNVNYINCWKVCVQHRLCYVKCINIILYKYDEVFKPE
jgi:hypothetical protein